MKNKRLRWRDEVGLSENRYGRLSKPSWDACGHASVPMFEVSAMNVRLSHLRITASAGTGKTFRLTDRIVELLLLGVEPRKILALTFTRKAAGEFL